MDDILLQSPASTLLSHFTKGDNAKLILRSGNVRLQKLRGVNDPKEALSWPFKLFCYDSQSVPLSGITSMMHKIENFVLDHVFVTCFRHDTQDTPMSSDYHNMNNKSFCDTRMWNEYADKHKGVCLVFDKMKLEKMFFDTVADAAFAGPVFYHNDFSGGTPNQHPYQHTIPNNAIPLHFQHCKDPFMINVELLQSLGVDEVITMHISYYYRQLLFQKNTFWKSENEYRLILFQKNIMPYCDMPFHDSIKAVILGDKGPNDDKNNIVNICMQKNIPVYHHVPRGWRNHFILDEQFKNENSIILDSSFTIGFPYDTVFLRCMSSSGKDKIISVDTTGAVKLIE